MRRETAKRVGLIVGVSIVAGVGVLACTSAREAAPATQAETNRARDTEEADERTLEAPASPTPTSAPAAAPPMDLPGGFSGLSGSGRRDQPGSPSPRESADPAPRAATTGTLAEQSSVGRRHRGAEIGDIGVMGAATSPPPRRSAMGGAGGGYGALPPPAALPQSGVLASNFVGGGGAAARLDDLLDRGVMVDGQRVRLEAFQDRERLPYAVPANEAVTMYSELERTRVHTGGERVHLQVALVARQGEAPARPRMDIRLVLDRSGSMQGEKWTQAIAAAHALVDRLAPTDTFGLISYSDDARLDLPPQRVGSRAAVHRAIDRLAPGGGTNIGAGMEMARANQPRRQAPSDVALVVLVSDGQATVGETNPQVLASSARQMFDADGVLTTSIGLGTDFSEDTMLSIAREGSGSYHFVRRAGDIAGILTDELDARAQAVAQAMRIRVVLADGVVARRVYGSRLLSEQEHAAVRTTEVATDTRLARELGITQTRARENEEGLRIHVPTFRRGDQHVILMELEVPRGTGTTPVARVVLDYKDLVRRQNATITQSVTAERSDDRDAVASSVRRPVKRTVLAFTAGVALQDAAEALHAGNPSGAARLLAERRELLEAASTLWRDPALARDASLLSRYERVLASAWPSWGDNDRRTLVMAMNYFGDRRMR